MATAATALNYNQQAANIETHEADGQSIPPLITQQMFGGDGPTVDPILKLHRARGKNAFVAVVTMKPIIENGKSRMVPTSDCAILVSDLDNIFPEFKAEVDQLDADSQWFYSINSFYKPRPGPGRGIAGLPRALRKKWAASYLTCLFCDIDGYNVGLDFGTLLGRIISLQDAGKFPPASVIKRSGRGAWLYWFLKDKPDTDQPPTAHAHRQVLWSLLQREINDRLSVIGADIGAKNVSRITRFPGSYNPKSGLRVVYWIQGGEDGKGFMYTMEQMADLLGVVIEEPRTGGKRSDRARNPGATDAVTLRLRDFQILRDLRGGGFDYGCRNIACVIYTWLLAKKGFRPDVIAKEVTRLGRACRPPLDSERIETDVKSGMDMAKHPRKKDAGCRDATIAAELRVTDDEARELPRFWRGGLPPGVPRIIVSRFQRRNLIRDILAAVAPRRLSCSDVQTSLLFRGVKVGKMTVARDMNLIFGPRKPGSVQLLLTQATTEGEGKMIRM
jgi:hypothetical protein